MTSKKPFMVELGAPVSSIGNIALRVLEGVGDTYRHRGNSMCTSYLLPASPKL